MSQNPIIDSGAKSSQTSGLKPVLATALASLEVQLDQELTRYRRTRSGSRQPKQVVTNQPQQSSDMTATLAFSQLSTPESNTNQIPGQNPSLGMDKQEEIDHSQVSSSQESSKIETPDDSKSSSSLVPTVKTAESETLLQTDDNSQQPDDYLESSEALLRSLTEEQTQTKKSSNSSDSLLSPLGIGSMLLLLLAALTLGYVVLNPKTLPKFNLGKLFNASSSESTVNTEVTEGNIPPTAEITPLTKYPNLATREFPEVRDPNDVVGLKPKVQPTPTPKPTPQPLALQTPIKSVVPPIPVPPITPTPKPQPTAKVPTQNEEIKPSSDGFYYLVIDNKGAGALAAAQRVVPDAYLSPNQKYIYLGALKTKEDAKRRLQELQAKGIKASVQE